jgi:holo-[acyl-carrier protein] synthase
MVIGIGVDIIEIDRIRAALENPKTGERFRQRVYTAEEIDYCSRRRRSFESFAARFAAKEAAIKALGQFAAWHEIEVVRKDGPPSLHLHGRARTRATELGVQRVFLSLSHSQNLAIAYVVVES